MRTYLTNLFSVNNYEKTTGQTKLYNINDLQKLQSITDYEDVPFIKRTTNSTIVNYDIEQVLIDKYSIILDLLKLSNDISLCGGSIDSLLTDKQVKDFDIFFHCGSQSEADRILTQCMDYLKPLATNFRTTQAVETVKVLNLEIQFIRRVYQTKEQVLIGFDLAPSRLGFNYTDKFFATSCGLIAVKNRFFPADTSQRSLSFDHRLQKYLNKGYDILLPGLDVNDDNYKPNIWEQKRTSLRCNDGKFSIYTGYDDMNTMTSDYDQDIREYVSARFVLKERFECFVLNEGKEWIPISELKDIEIDMSNYSYCRIDPTIDFIKLFFKDQAQQFILAKLCGDQYLCKQLWTNKFQYYNNIAQNFMSIIKANPWKIDNPGSQNFGRLHPINEVADKWYGQNYKEFPIDVLDEKTIDEYRQRILTF